MSDLNKFVNATKDVMAIKRVEKTGFFDKLADIDESLVKYKPIHVGAMLATGILAGYCLQPVPTFINDAFNKSNVLKFFTLSAMGMLAMYPADKKTVITVLVMIVIFLIIMEYARDYDVNVYQKKTERNEDKYPYYNPKYPHYQDGKGWVINKYII